MAIDKAQLETWSHQGSITQSSDTYNMIKNALETNETPYSDKDFKVFLQGSYRNDTNIWSESDVDIVIRLDACFQSDLERLSEPEKTLYRRTFPDADYAHSDFKRDVLKVLVDKYGKDVKVGDKAITIAANGNRRKADVIVAIQYRRYHKFNGTANQAYTEGICFWNRSGTMISNYPELHSKHLTVKHQGTNSYLKPMIRILKNIRGRCVSEGLLKDGVAPSYYLEGLLYNVPLGQFAKSYQDCFVNAFKWIQNNADKSKFVCTNEQYYLLYDNSPVCWPKGNGEAFINAAIKLWNDWGK